VPAEDDVVERHLRLVGALFVSIALSAAACAGSQTTPNGEEKAGETATPASSASASASADEPPPKWNSKPSPKEDPLTEDQKAQMEIALRRGGDKAANCASVVADAKPGEGEVKVTFDGKKGRATDVAVGAPWAGTPTEACIKRAFIGEIIVPFEGELEVPYTVKIGGKAEPAKDPKKGTPPKKK
jgi:hypothetical protein